MVCLKTAEYGRKTETAEYHEEPDSLLITTEHGSEITVLQCSAVCLPCSVMHSLRMTLHTHHISRNDTNVCIFVVFPISGGKLKPKISLLNTSISHNQYIISSNGPSCDRIYQAQQ